MFEGKTIDELIECVMRAEHRARQHSDALVIEDKSASETDSSYFLLGAA